MQAVRLARLVECVETEVVANLRQDQLMLVEGVAARFRKRVRYAATPPVGVGFLQLEIDRFVIRRADAIDRIHIIHVRFAQDAEGVEPEGGGCTSPELLALI